MIEFVSFIPIQREVSMAQNKAEHKERGFWLSFFLVIMALHGIAAAFLYDALRTDASIERTWLVSLMVVHSLANVLAAAGIWYWKKWALYVYAGSTVLAVVVGLLAVGAWSVFYFVLPLAIVGWVLRNKWAYFT